MNIRRELELEDATQPAMSKDAGDLLSQLDKAKTTMNKALHTATQQPMKGESKFRLLVVDDNATFLDSLLEAAKKLAQDKSISLNITTLVPTQLLDVKNCILGAFENKAAFDYVLLDFCYEGQSFTGLDLLRTLRPDERSHPLFEQESKHIRLFYLPVAIVTRGGSTIDPNEYFEEEALGAGADKVYSEKGLGSEESKEQEAVLTPMPLLESLLKGGFKEMRFRAWVRLWQDLREELEERIKEQLDANRWMKEKDVIGALEYVWEALAKPIKHSGYATHLSMRILVKHKIKHPTYWQLRKIGSTDMDGCPVNIPWDALPLLKDCLTEERHLIHAVQELKEEQLVSDSYRDYPGIEKFRNYLGRSAMAARIDSKVSPVGTFLITRNKGEPPFFNEDQAHLRIIVERLGLFERELRMRQRNHRRQLALVRLGRELLEVDKEDIGAEKEANAGELNEEDIIVAKAVKVLHVHLHLARSMFTENADKNPALNGRVSIRLIEHGTGRLMRPDQRAWIVNEQKTNIPRWALGFDTKDKVPRKITVFRDDRYSDERYIPLIEGEKEEGKKKEKLFFFPNAEPKDVDPTREGRTHAKMLAPIKAGPVVVGTINVEHKQAEFYGKESYASAYYALLQGVALEVGHALRSLRARRMLRKLLQLHTSTGEAEQEQVIKQIMEILYDYTACAVGIWMEQKAGEWQIGAVWECPQGYTENEPPPTKFAINHKKPSNQIEENRLERWRQHIMPKFGDTLIGKVVEKCTSGADQDLVFYQEEEGFLDDESMGIRTRSQAVLMLRDPETNELLGVFGLLFNQMPGLDIKRQQPLLTEAARFAASYLSIRRKNRQYVLNSQIMEQQTALGLAYQQLRHCLNLQLGGINGTIDSLILKLENCGLCSTDTDEIAKKIKQTISNISKDVDMSKALMKVPHPHNIDLSVVWQEVSEQLKSYAEKENVEILPMPESAWVCADADIVKMVFTNLLDNAIEAMAGARSPRKIECIILPDKLPDKRRVAVRNTGSVINPEIANRLFKDIGLSTKSAGTGFGTYFSGFMLERSGAHIEYDPSWQEGAQFVLSFPVKQPSSGEAL